MRCCVHRTVLSWRPAVGASRSAVAEGQSLDHKLPRFSPGRILPWRARSLTRTVACRRTGSERLAGRKGRRVDKELWPSSTVDRAAHAGRINPEVPEGTAWEFHPFTPGIERLGGRNAPPRTLHRQRIQRDGFGRAPGKAAPGPAFGNFNDRRFGWGERL